MEITYSNRVRTSTDGITWTDTQGLQAALVWSSIAFGNGKFVATGYYASNKIAVSTDAITWTVTAGPANVAGTIFYAFGKFILVTGTTAAFTSTDGTTWEALTLPASCSMLSFDGTTILGAAISGNDVSSLITSTDGINWISHGGVTVSPGAAVGVILGYQAILVLVTNGNILLSTGFGQVSYTVSNVAIKVNSRCVYALN